MLTGMPFQKLNTYKMINKIQEGKKLDFVNTTGTLIKSGALVVFGALTAVAITDIAAGDTGAVDLQGVFRFPKVAGAIAQGAKLYFVTADQNLTTVAGSNALVGAAAQAALAGDTEVNLLILN
jgi:predicted RecA/RadA family phage recombinase